MYKFLNWLLLPTPDGATWLQAVITVILLCAVIYLFYQSIIDLWDDIKEGDDNIDKTNN